LVDLVLSILYQPTTYEAMKHCARKTSIPSGKARFYDLLRDLRDPRLGHLPERWTSGGEGVRGQTGLEWFGSEELLSHLENKWKHKEEVSEGEKSYLEYRTDQLLCSPLWQDRNTGVKLTGLIGYNERLPALLHSITDRTPVPWHRRLLGGDFQEVGFIRRNALQAVWRMKAYDPGVRQALLTALSDPYYEVRSWAARGVERLSPSIGEDTELERLLRKNLQDRWFEVVVNSLRALGGITKDPTILSDLVPLLAHKNWKVQQATVRCLMRLLQADVVRLPREAEEWMHKIPMKGLDFFPRFPLKQTWDDFQDLLSEKMEQDNRSNTGKGVH
jgi:UDP-N-acetylglucosamine--N-acetylmuramyl-(pentapeptide) pyrophosphoryl-undecaprenol N-acetylglucosamine transferase